LEEGNIIDRERVARDVSRAFIVAASRLSASIEALRKSRELAVVDERRVDSDLASGRKLSKERVSFD
jgi:hypothetical protein